MTMTTSLLAAVRDDHARRYHQFLSEQSGFRVEIVTRSDDVLGVLGDHNRHIDVLILDNGLDDDDAMHAFIKELRGQYPRMLMVLVDEEADFALPGIADDISIEPVESGDLMRRVKRLIEDRQMETQRSDALPAVRDIAQRMRNAAGAKGKREEAVRACLEMDYDYVAYYYIAGSDPLALTLQAQEGPRAILSVAPKQATAADLMGWVAQHGQSRIAAPDDDPNHPLVARGRLGAVACVPVMFNQRTYGVIAACRDRPDSISQENVMMLELLGAQLASALAKETLL